MIQWCHTPSVRYMDRNKSAIIHQTCWILTVFYNTNIPTYLIIFGARKSVQIAPNIATTTIYHFSKMPKWFQIGETSWFAVLFRRFPWFIGFHDNNVIYIYLEIGKIIPGPIDNFYCLQFLNKSWLCKSLFSRRPLYLWMVSLMKSLVEIGKKWFHFSCEMKFIKFLSFLNHAVFPYFPFILKLTHRSVVETKSFDKCMGFVWQFLRRTFLNWINCAKSCQPNKSQYQFIQWQQVWSNQQHIHAPKPQR